MNRPLRLLAALAPALIAATAHAGDRENLNAYGLAPSVSIVGATPAGARVAARDQKTGAPTLLFSGGVLGKAAKGATAETAGKQHLATFAAHYGMRAPDVATAEIDHVHDIGRGGIVATFRQKIGGIEVFHHDAKVLMNRSFDLIAIGGGLHAKGGSAPRGKGFALDETDALAIAMSDLFGSGVVAKDFLDNQNTAGGYRHFDLSAHGKGATKKELERPARVKKVWFALPDRLVPGYFLEVFARTPKSHENQAYAFVIAADDGRLLYRENLTHYDAFNYRVWADTTGDHRCADGPLVDYSPYPTAKPNGSYPGFAPSVLISMEGFNTNPQHTSDPWLPPTAVDTNGNNVDAYTDDDNPDGFSANDIRAATTSDHTFDRTYDFTQGPQSSDYQRMASVTQLFYQTNWMHDYWYDSGFNEAAKNAQQDNFGRGGVAGDPLQAQGQDGAPTQRNNSNMQVPADGSPPIMQMYVWDGKQDRTLTVGATSYVNGPAEFGPTTFDLTAEVVLADDGTGTTTDACEPLPGGALPGTVAGKIVLVDRGNCNFQLKAVTAQNAGAAGVIVADNDAANTTPLDMGGDNTQPAVTIPVLGITLTDGNTLKTALAGGPTSATMHRQSGVDRDGTIDNTVSAHEWGHYLHLRQVDCSQQQCLGQSEGWADFNALMMVFRPGNDHQGIYPLAVYAVASFPDDPAYFGIRRYPYSANFDVDPLTFKHIQSGQALPPPPPNGPPVGDVGAPNNEVHSVGEIWAAMLFEAYVSLLDRATGPGSPYTEDEAHRRMADYVVGGLQLAPTDPTFTEQRDAVLAAAAANDKDDFVAMAKAFAKRGAGSCAVSPDRDSRDMTGVVEDFGVSPNATITSLTLDDKALSCDHDGYLDPGESGRVTVEIANTGAASLTGAKLALTSSSKDVTFPKGAKVDVPDLKPFESAKIVVPAAIAADAKGPIAFDIAAELAATTGCAKSSKASASFHADVDEKEAASATDDVEAKATTWTPSGKGAKAIWSRTDQGNGNHVWTGVDFGSPSDTQLVSPLLDVADGKDFVLSFDHAYSFEQSGGTNWDGAVIEISSDDDLTWQDVSMFGTPGYGGMIGDSMAHNPLLGKNGFVGKSTGYPKLEHAKIDLGKSFANKKVKIRFRIGTDDAQGEPGWTIDNIAFDGITNTPFTELVANADNSGCEPGTGGGGGSAPATGGGGAGGTGGAVDGTTDDSGGCGCELPGHVGETTAPSVALLAALGAVLRRRRRRA